MTPSGVANSSGCVVTKFLSDDSGCKPNITAIMAAFQAAYEGSIPSVCIKNLYIRSVYTILSIKEHCMSEQGYYDDDEHIEPDPNEENALEDGETYDDEEYDDEEYDDEEYDDEEYDDSIEDEGDEYYTDDADDADDAIEDEEYEDEHDEEDDI